MILFLLLNLCLITSALDFPDIDSKVITPLGGHNVTTERLNQGFGVEFCLIGKTGITITQYILCDVLREYKGIPYVPQYKRQLHYKNECREHKNYRFIRGSTWARPTSEPVVRFTLVREPLDRFISLYGFVCKYRSECPAEIRNIHRFARWLYHKQKMALAGKRFPSERLEDILAHSWPQTSFCGLKDKMSDLTFVHHSTNRTKMQDEMMSVFDKAHVPAEVAKKALAHLTRSSTAHAGKSESKRALLEEIKGNADTMRYINAMYHEDFEFLKTHTFT
ncbi:unnamed protein product, partial [Mesorhabditis belari]|uniref:Sulfotransferase n=1 Tax=Mesorhabditis belari TaxID=2138241 RepID=A0AAF3EKK8_9BILA